MHIFSPSRIKPFFKWSSSVLIVANILLYISGIILSAITCNSHESIWHPWVRGRCVDRRSLGLATAFFNLFLDIAILILPQRIIWSMKMRSSRRLGVSMIFSVGLLTVACAVGRLVATFQADYYGDATCMYLQLLAMMCICNLHIQLADRHITLLSLVLC